MGTQRRVSPLLAVLVVLIVIGIFGQIQQGALGLLIPVGLVAIVWLLYKFPPSRFMRGGSSRSAYQRAAVQSRKRQQARSEADKPKRRPTPFRVIEGNKNRDDDPPPYH
ncbi:hypothetical protein [Cohnella nanjingensis]|uniref:Uncharacterized protein n=1 Tax=Cohnella nanjingensis TaxID=1387779 RepID=A0A7X0RZC5_9BACL|nr:hypothetical protein [Cohnella nanjingensis]MBB6675256.1 hypothetical protein [Cohnella nanjingensis]